MTLDQYLLKHKDQVNVILDTNESINTEVHKRRVAGQLKHHRVAPKKFNVRYRHNKAPIYS